MATIFKLLRAKARVAFELSRLTFSGVGYLLHPTYGNEKKKNTCSSNNRAVYTTYFQSDLLTRILFPDTEGSAKMLPPTALGPSAIAIWETSSTTAGSSAAATSQTYASVLNGHPEMTEMTVGEGVEMQKS